jgi:hypothetical protein
VFKSFEGVKNFMKRFEFRFEFCILLRGFCFFSSLFYFCILCFILHFKGSDELLGINHLKHGEMLRKEVSLSSIHSEGKTKHLSFSEWKSNFKCG